MRKINNYFKLCLCTFLFIIVSISAVSLEAEELTLRIYNWEDYISDGKDDEGNSDPTIPDVIELFKEYYKEVHGENINVEYVTYATNEIMLSTLETGKSQYDLICPSDYVIQKMIKKNMLETIDGEIENYQKYCSPYIKDLFSSNGWDKYGVCYMWGTLGFLYDPENVTDEDVTSWSVMWNDKYQYKVTTKDSMRDTYVAAVAYVYVEEMLKLKEDVETGKITYEFYNQELTKILNRCDDETIELVGEALAALKLNIFGFEVDSGKTDITTGKILINYAWSGDAVYAMDIAEIDADKKLKYSVPEEGSNIFFDAWVMPKGANKKLAQEFMNFVCLPEIAVYNMEKIGYTSSIAGDAVFERILEYYGDDEGEYTVDLSYFFGDTISENYLTDGKALVQTSELDRQFSTQYPSLDTVRRCTIMQDFGDQNEKVMAMWQEFKSENVYYFGAVLLSLSALGYVGYLIYNRSQKRVRIQRMKEKQANQQKA